MVNAQNAIVALSLASAAEAVVIYYMDPSYVRTHTLTVFIGGLALLNVAIYLLYGQFLYPYFNSPLRDLPTPKGSLLLGNMGHIIKKPPGLKFLEWDRTIPNGGIIRFLGVFKEDRILVTSPEALKVVLSERVYDYEKPPRIRDFLTRILGRGVLMVEGDEHRFQRKHLTSSFALKHIRGLYPIFWEKSKAMVNQIQSQVTESSSIIELNDWATRTTLDIIGAAGLGRDFGSLRNPNDELVQKYNELLEPTKEKSLYFALNMLLPQSITKLFPWRLNAELNETIRVLTNYALGTVHDRQAELGKAQESKTERADILTMLVKSGDFRDTELADQFLTFIAAGHETTSTTLTWVGYLMAKHPEIQERLREEIRETLPSLLSVQTPSSTEIEDMPYLNAVCNETLRLYPAVPATMRETITDTEVPMRTNAGYVQRVIPKGTRVAIPIWAINRSRDIWGSDADEYVPDRWLGEGKANTGGQSSNYAQMTFLHGPRSCIGQGFAKAELKCLVAALVGRFEITLADPDEDVQPAGVLTSKPANGMHLIMKPLDGW